MAWGWANAAANITIDGKSVPERSGDDDFDAVARPRARFPSLGDVLDCDRTRRDHASHLTQRILVHAPRQRVGLRFEGVPAR